MANRRRSESGWRDDDETVLRNRRMLSCGELSCSELPCGHRCGLPVGPIGVPHLAQCHQERERCLRTLISVDPIGMESVATAASRRIVEPLMDGVLAEKPVEGAIAVLHPAGLAGDAISREAGRRDGTGFNRLLIECGGSAASR